MTGANGFVGTNLCSYLSKNGFEVLRSDISKSDADGDITDQSFVTDVLASRDFEGIVHLAGIVNIPKSLEDPYNCYRINCFGTLNLLKMALNKKVERFVYASSNNVYGSPNRLPVREEDPYKPNSPYDYSKVVAEHFVRSFHIHKQLPSTVLRSWNMFGPHDLPNRAVPRFITACLSGELIPLYNGGRDSDDFYHVDNYCRAVSLALRSPRAVGDVFNVGTGGEASVRELAELVKKVTGSKSKLQILPPRTPLEKRPRRTRPSIRKIRSLLGYKPTVSLKEGIERTVEWYRKSDPGVGIEA